MLLKQLKNPSINMSSERPCLFHELFTSSKVPEFTPVMCSNDDAILNPFLPEKLVFHRNEHNITSLNGHGCCEFAIGMN